MENALPLFGLAAVVWGAGIVIHALGYWWVRAKQLERTNPPPILPQADAPAIDSRLARIESAVEAVAIEVERLGEAHRFVARLQGEGAADEDVVPPPREPQHRDRS